MLRIERRILSRNGVEPKRERRARLGDSFPAIGRGRRIGRWRGRRLIDQRTRHRNDAGVLGTVHDVARSTVIGRPFTSRALSEDTAQTEEDKDRQRQENDGVNIHVVFTF